MRAFALFRGLASWLAPLVVVAAGPWGAPLNAAPPALTNLAPRGLRVGAATTLVVEGRDLDAATRLLAPFAIAGQRVLEGGGPTNQKIEITLAADVPPGLYPVWAFNGRGISVPLVIGVDDLPQLPFADKVEALPAALHGNLSGSQILKVSFAGKAGQRVAADVEGKRLGSALRPVLRLLDPRGAQIAWSPPRPRIEGDARCEATLAADGQYTVELHDLLYRGAGPGHFRLKLGDLAYADWTLPTGAQRGQATDTRLYATNLPGDARAALGALGPSAWHAPAIAIPHFTGAAPSLAASDHPEVLEAPSASGPQTTPGAPLAITGVLGAQGEEDRYQLPTRPGAKLRFDLQARGWGSPLDGVLVIRDAAGRELARGDDRAGGTDPLVDFTVPDKVEQIVVAVSDLLKRGEPDYLYRLEVRDLGRPDFELRLAEREVVVPAGGAKALKIEARRAGYNGPIEFEAAGLPPGARLAEGGVLAGASAGLVLLTADSAGPSAAAARLLGRATEGEVKFPREALASDPPQRVTQPNALRGLAVAVGDAAPLTASWRLPADARLVNGGSLVAPVALGRTANVAGKARCELVSSHVAPKKTVKQNNQDVQVDDPDRALRLVGEVEFGPEVAEPTVRVLAPPDLPEQPWQMALVVSLLSADGKTTIASVATPIQVVASRRAFSVELVGPSAIEAKAGEGPTGEFKGKVTRQEGFAHPVKLEIAGLPTEYPAPNVVIAADQTEFTLSARFPFGVKPAELKNLRLTARMADPADAQRDLAQAPPLDVTIKVVAGEKPADK